MQILIVKAPLDSLSVMQQIDLEDVLLVALLASEATLQARQHLRMLFNLHLYLLIGSLEHLKGLAADSEDVPLGSRPNRDTL